MKLILVTTLALTPLLAKRQRTRPAIGRSGGCVFRGYGSAG